MSYQFLLDGTDITDKVNEAVIEVATTIMVDKLSVKLTADANVGQIIEFYENSSLRFKGTIEKSVLNEDGSHSIEAFGEGNALNKTRAVEVFVSKSPEYIVEYLIGKYTNLNYASTETSGMTIERYILDDFVSRGVTDMANLLDWQVRIGYPNNFYFEPKGIHDSGKTYTIGVNANLVDINEDTTRMANSIQIKGDKQEFQTTETFTGDGTTKEFQVLYYPEQVKVKVDGTEKTGGITSGDGDYYVDKVNKKIIFNTAPSNGANIEVNYSYLVPVSIRMEDPTSVSTYGTYSKKITNPNLKTFSDARNYGKAYLKTYAYPLKSYIVSIPGYDDVEVGYKANFIYSQKGINKQLTVIKKDFKYPSGTTELTLGEYPENLTLWQEDVQARILNLEKSLSNETVVQDYRLISERIPIDIKVSRLTVKYRDKTGIIILDDPDVYLDDDSFALDEGDIKPWTTHYEVNN